MSFEAPLVLHEQSVPEAWIDFNGHMNVAYYVYAFDRGMDGLMDRVGLDAAHRVSAGGTIFAVEAHVTYQRELLKGDPIRVSLQLLGHDRKRVHSFWRMHHAQTGQLAATAEWISLYVDLNSRKVVEMPDAIFEQLSAIQRAHALLPWPPEAGRSVGAPRVGD